jgi:hypothetical protein
MKEPVVVNLDIKNTRREGAARAQEIGCDICVVGAGISGVSAALEAAKLGREVVLLDGLPALGGQAVNSLIGTFCGLFSNGPEPYQVTYGIADDILDDLGAEGALHYRRGPVTNVVMYDEIALSRWVEKAILDAGIKVVVGAIVRGVERDGRRIKSLDVATRYGDVKIAATGFVDASGDAVLAWQSGLECREPTAPIYGSQMMIVENIDEDAQPSREEMSERVAEKYKEYGMTRGDGFAFVFPARGLATVNMTHVETPLEPVEASRKGIEGKRQADRVLDFLKGEFPAGFGDASVRSYGFPGIRQTRWIVGTHHLTVDEVVGEVKFDDAIARTSWPIELHKDAEGLKWSHFGPGHMHYVPLGSIVHGEADNLCAAGRCIDGDPAALSSVRVMGPCIATAAAAAHALDLAGSGSVHQIDIAALQDRLKDNLTREDVR